MCRLLTLSMALLRSNRQISQKFLRSDTITSYAIAKSECFLYRVGRDNFIEIQLDRINNFGATVQSKAYRLTRDGFTFLVMGYTGEKAARFKWAYIDEFNRQQTLLESKALPPTQSERTMFAGDSLAENVLRGLSGQMDAETVGDKLVTIGTVLQVVGTIQKVPASGPQLQAALNAFQQALEESCDADELEKQRRRSLKARNAARARWDRIRQGGAE